MPEALSDALKTCELMLGDTEHGDGLLRGVRHIAAHDRRPEDLLIALPTPAYLYGQEDFRAGLRQLGRAGLSFDAWHFHHQNEDFIELARAVPDTQLILNHFGTPLGVGIYRGQRDTIFAQWREDMKALARCPNVVIKLGGLLMPDNGFGWDQRPQPPSSDAIVAQQQRYYQHAIDCFGVSRCLFESNFPVDRLSVSYAVLFNAFKKMVADCSTSEKQALFHDNAARIYRLNGATA